MPAPATGESLAERIHRFLTDYHDPSGYTPAQIAAVLQPPPGFDPAKWPQNVRNQLARQERKGALVKTTDAGVVRYRRESAEPTEEERRDRARTRLRDVGVSITTQQPYPPETWEAAAGVFTAAALTGATTP